MIFKSLFYSLFFYIGITCSFSQFNFTYQNIEFETGEIAYNQKDTITYLYSKGTFSDKKSNLFWLQGSLPTPLIFEINDSTYHIVPISNFRLDSLVSKFNIFIISKPFTPICKKINELNDHYKYAPDLNNPYCYDSNYMKTDYLEYTATRISFFINYINKKHSVSGGKTVLIGHSQGMREASKVGAINKNITHNVMLSSNPTGRIQESILANRIAFIKNEIDSAEYIKNRNHIYEFWNDVITDTTDLGCYKGSHKTTRSFSSDMTPDLLKSNAKMFIAMGSEDAGSMMLDLMPLDFIREKKEIPTLKIYEGLDHNFFPKDKEGNPDYQNGKWNDVMLEVYEWLENN